MNDRKLLALLKDDPNAGMTQLIRQYSGFVFTVAGGILSEVCDSSEIEDCVTDVFLHFYSGAASFRSDASIKTYLGIAARNAALNCARSRLPREPIEDGDFTIEIPGSTDPGEEAAEKDLLERVFKDVYALGRPDSEIIIRKYYLGQSACSIARALRMTVSNVNTRAYRAVRKLRKKYGGENV